MPSCYVNPNIGVAFSLDGMVAVLSAARAIFLVLGRPCSCLVHPFSDPFILLSTWNQRSWCSCAPQLVGFQFMKCFSAGTFNLQVGSSMSLSVGYSWAAGNGFGRELACIFDELLFSPDIFDQYNFQHRNLVRQALCVFLSSRLIRRILVACTPSLKSFRGL